MTRAAQRISAELLQRTALDPLAPEYRQPAEGMPPAPPMGWAFWAIVQSSTPQNSDPTTQWTYTVRRAIKTSTGYGAAKWTTNSTDLTAYNAAENINSTSGRQGNGIDVANLDIDGDEVDDFGFYPIQNGTPVFIVAVPVATTIEYWIIGAGVPNGVDGSCP